MSQQPPQDGDPARFSAGSGDGGRVPALITWALYILSIPSANVLVLVGLVVAYASRDAATGLSREHLDAQIKLFWSVFWWTIACWIALAVSLILTVILIGIPFLILFGVLWLLITIWFTVKSIFGLLNLLNDRAP
jgi:uncharacterized membrane protein